MAAMNPVWIAAAIAISSPASASSVGQWRPLIAEAATRFRIPQQWIERVMQAESGGRVALSGRPITSPKGAMGLMQLMPATWAEIRASLQLGHNPHDPRDNILAGAAYLRRMYDQFGYPGLFAAYNAGPRRYADHLATRRSLPAETRAYLAQVASGRAAAITRRGEPSMRLAAGTALLFVRLGTTPGRSSALNAPQPEGLFAIRRVEAADRD